MDNAGSAGATAVIRAVIFDMDGILVDSEPVWETVRRPLVLDTGGRWTDSIQHQLMGMSTAEWASYLTAEAGAQMPAEVFAQAAIARVVEEYRRHLPLLPGAVEAVRRMSRHYVVGLASSSPPSVIRYVLQACGLDQVFSATAASDEVPRGKPAPDVYLLAAGRLAIDPAACVAVEDSSNGLRAAAAAGLQVVAVPRVEYPPDPDALALARWQLDSLDQLTAQLLEGLLG